MKQLKWKWFDHRTDLPRGLAARIGQIVVEWSVLERELEELIQMLMNTDIGMARIATNRMNARTRISSVSALLEWYVYHDRFRASYLKEFVKIGKRIATKTQNKRDVVAHGLWSRVGGEWCVLKLRGHRSTPELSPELEKLSRTFWPQREVITAETLDATIREIISEARVIEDFCKRLHRALPSEPFQYAPPKYTRRRRDLRGT